MLVFMRVCTYLHIGSNMDDLCRKETWKKVVKECRGFNKNSPAAAEGTADQQQGDGGSAGFYLHQRSMAGASGTALSRFVNRCLLQQLVSRLSGATRPLVSYPPRLKQAFPGFT